jgi:hypothetical protein
MTFTKTAKTFTKIATKRAHCTPIWKINGNVINVGVLRDSGIQIPGLN